MAGDNVTCGLFFLMFSFVAYELEFFYFLFLFFLIPLPLPKGWNRVFGYGLDLIALTTLDSKLM